MSNEETFLLSVLPVRVEGGDSEFNGESEQSSGSGDRYYAMLALLLRHFHGVSSTFRHCLFGFFFWVLSHQTAMGREGNLGRAEKEGSGN